ncbi:MAG: four-carbon acid sugar kinase family protein, partial [Anaerolineae bacterium]|nr:four-carbon acid sugar kinase family protein [Anaerolineae bacterium]
MMTTSVVVIADDLTGAADSAAAFARQGFRTMVLWEGTPLPEADVLVFTTESRHGSVEEAIRRVDEAARRFTTAPNIREQAWIYKKVDSTLRGHPGPELAALMAGLGAPRVLVAPAFPAQGRVTRNGTQYVHGIPLAESAFGREVRTSSVSERFAVGFARGAVHRLMLTTIRKGVAAVAAVLASTEGIVVADAETDADLDNLTAGAHLSNTRLLCGSAGLAGALTRTLTTHAGKAAQPAQQPKRRWVGESMLVVAASRHPQTVRQVETAEASGIAVIRPGLAWFLERNGSTLPLPGTGTSPSPPRDGARREARTEQEALLADCTRHLGHESLIITSQGLPELPGRGADIVAYLAEIVHELITRTPPAGLVLTGGDIAMGVGRALGAEALRL